MKKVILHCASTNVDRMGCSEATSTPLCLSVGGKTSPRSRDVITFTVEPITGSKDHEMIDVVSHPASQIIWLKRSAKVCEHLIDSASVTFDVKA
jgi:hypothetical protein